MAEVMKRAGRAGTVVGTLLRTAAVSHSTCTTSVLQREDVGSTSSPRIENLRELATAAVCAAFGAAAVSTSCNEPVRAEQAGDSNQSSEKTALNPDDWVKFTLKETQPVTHNTKIYRFVFDPDSRLGLSIASCLLTRALTGAKDGQPIMVVRPPISKLPYCPNMKKPIGMIAGGTGITPMLQLIDTILSNPDDNTQISLVYVNVTPEDILLKEKLDLLAQAHPNFKVYYVVDKPTEKWKGGAGFINKATIVKALPSPDGDTIMLARAILHLRVGGDQRSPSQRSLSCGDAVLAHGLNDLKRPRKDMEGKM